VISRIESGQHATSARTLKRLAEAHVFYELNKPGLVKSATFSHAESRRSNAAAAATATIGPWDTFSTRNLALRSNQRMAREFDGDASKIRAASVKEELVP